MRIFLKTTKSIRKKNHEKEKEKTWKDVLRMNTHRRNKTATSEISLLILKLAGQLLKSPSKYTFGHIFQFGSV